MYVSSRFGGSLFALFVVIASSAPAATHYVAPGGTNNSPYSSWADASSTIQPAINAAVDGDTVVVSNGTYNLTNSLTIDKAITFRSLSGQTNTFINGGYPTYIGTCFHVAKAACIDGFTITNGRAAHGGGMVFYPDATGAVVTNCVIAGNTASENGGGIYLNGANATIANCVIAGNTAHAGGGINMAATGTVINCIISNNTIPASTGGGVFLSGGKLVDSLIIGNRGPGTAVGGIDVNGSGIVSNCTIQGNYGEWYGGGVMISQSASVLNCRIIDNYTSINYSLGGGGVAIMGGLLKDCIISNNYTLGYDTMGGGVWIWRDTDTTYPVLVCDCLITSNSTAGTGGGLQIRDRVHSTNTAVVNCTIVNNYARDGGGLYLCEGTTNNGLFNLIVDSNTSSPGGADDLGWLDGGWPKAQINLVNSCTPTVWPGSGSTTNDPIFAGPANGNWRLQKGSPCINTGLNQDWMTGAVDRDGHPRKDRFSEIVDMGCYEYVASGSMYIGR